MLLTQVFLFEWIRWLFYKTHVCKGVYHIRNFCILQIEILLHWHRRFHLFAQAVLCPLISFSILRIAFHRGFNETRKLVFVDTVFNMHANAATISPRSHHAARAFLWPLLIFVWLQPALRPEASSSAAAWGPAHQSMPGNLRDFRGRVGLHWTGQITSFVCTLYGFSD